MIACGRSDKKQMKKRYQDMAQSFRRPYRACGEEVSETKQEKLGNEGGDDIFQREGNESSSRRTLPLIRFWGKRKPLLNSGFAVQTNGASAMDLRL